MSKVLATLTAIRQIDPTIQVQTVEDRYRPRLEKGDAIFCCVDSIDARADLAFRPETLPFLVRRTHARRRHPCPRSGRRPRPRALSGDVLHPSRSQPGRCTARSTIYAAAIAAGLMVHQFTPWLRAIPVDQDVSLNLLAGELTAS